MLASLVALGQGPVHNRIEPLSIEGMAAPATQVFQRLTAIHSFECVLSPLHDLICIRRQRVVLGRHHKDLAWRDASHNVLNVELLREPWNNKRHFETHAVCELVPK